jgi:hypothetical protein
MEGSFPYMPGSLATYSVLLYEVLRRRRQNMTGARSTAPTRFIIFASPKSESERSPLISDLGQMQHHVPRSNAHTQQISHPLLSSGNARTRPLTRTEYSMRLQSLEPKPKQTVVKRVDSLRQGPVRPDDGMASMHRVLLCPPMSYPECG